MGQTITFPRLLGVEGGDFTQIPGFAEAISLFTTPFLYIDTNTTLYQLAVETFSLSVDNLGNVFWESLQNFFPGDAVLFAKDAVSINTLDDDNIAYTVPRSLRALLKRRTMPVPQVAMCKTLLYSKLGNHFALLVFYRPANVIGWTVTTFNLHHSVFVSLETIATELQYALAPTIIIPAPASTCEDPQGGVGNCVGWGLLFAFYIAANPEYMVAPDELLRRINTHTQQRSFAAELIIEFYFFLCIHAIYVTNERIVGTQFSNIATTGKISKERAGVMDEIKDAGLTPKCGSVPIDVAGAQCDTTGEYKCDMSGEYKCKEPSAPCTICDSMCVDTKVLKIGCTFYSIPELLLKMYHTIDIEATLRRFSSLGLDTGGFKQKSVADIHVEARARKRFDALKKDFIESQQRIKDAKNEYRRLGREIGDNKVQLKVLGEALKPIRDKLKPIESIILQSHLRSSNTDLYAQSIRTLFRNRHDLFASVGDDNQKQMELLLNAYYDRAKLLEAMNHKTASIEKKFMEAKSKYDVVPAAITDAMAQLLATTAREMERVHKLGKLLQQAREQIVELGTLSRAVKRRADSIQAMEGQLIKRQQQGEHPEQDFFTDKKKYQCIIA